MFPNEELEFLQKLIDQGVIETLVPDRPATHGEARPPANAPARYEILNRIGEGAMAVVYQARDLNLNRLVALKVLREPMNIDLKMRHRFHREAETAGRLSDPNVIAVYDAGEADGRMYLVMELVEGSSLAEVLANRPGEIRPLLLILEKASRGVAAAHKKGIVHRDLKPANIMITLSGEPKVGDFGLAHLMGSETHLTKSGSTLGTPMYMAPEQAMGQAEDVTPRTDVYSLGVILYQILTGRPPHRGANFAELCHRIMYDEPVRPRKLNPRVDAEVETICLKALEKAPARRYPNAEAFANDLRRYLNGEPVQAHPISTVRRFLRKGRKHHAMIASVATLLTLLGGWAGVEILRKTARVRTRLADAVRLEKEGKIVDARSAYENVLELNRDHPEALQGFRRMEGLIHRLAADRAETEARAKAQDEAFKLLEKARPALDRATLYLYDKDANYAELVDRLKETQTWIEEAIEKAPHLALAHYLLGRTWEMKGWWDRAEACWRKAIEQDPDFGPAHSQLGRLLVARTYVAMTALSPQQRLAARYLADEATRELKAAMASGSGFDDELQRQVAEATLAYALDEPGRGLRVVQEGLERFNGRLGVEELHWTAGLATSGEEAIRRYDRAILIRPRYSLARFCRANEREERGDLDGTIADLDEALKVHPRFIIAYCNRGRARLKKRDIEGATADYDEAIRIDPRCEFAYCGRGFTRYRKSDFDGAILDFTEALAINPRYADAYCGRGEARYAKGDLDGAILDFTEALAINPRYAEAYCGRGHARGAKGDADNAITDFDEALRLKPGLAAAHFGRGMARHANRDFDGAIADFDEVLRTDPQNAKARFSRGLARLQESDLDGAMEDFEEAIRLDPLLPETYYGRGLVRQARDDVGGAGADFKKALDIAPSEWPWRPMVEKRLSKLKP